MTRHVNIDDEDARKSREALDKRYNNLAVLAGKKGVLVRLNDARLRYHNSARFFIRVTNNSQIPEDASQLYTLKAVEKRVKTLPNRIKKLRKGTG